MSRARSPRDALRRWHAVARALPSSSAGSCGSRSRRYHGQHGYLASLHRRRERSLRYFTFRTSRPFAPFPCPIPPKRYESATVAPSRNPGPCFSGGFAPWACAIRKEIPCAARSPTPGAACSPNRHADSPVLEDGPKTLRPSLTIPDRTAYVPGVVLVCVRGVSLDQTKRRPRPASDLEGRRGPRPLPHDSHAQ
jgi:hypothetical protein